MQTVRQVKSKLALKKCLLMKVTLFQILLADGNQAQTEHFTVNYHIYPRFKQICSAIANMKTQL